MAGGLTDAAEKLVADRLFGLQTLTPPSTYYFALYTDSNTDAQHDAGTFTEVNTGDWTNYARVAVTNNLTNFPAASGITALKQNATAISWGTAVIVTPVTIRGWVAYSAASGGTAWAWGSFTAQTVNNGNPVSFPIDALSITTD